MHGVYTFAKVATFKKRMQILTKTTQKKYIQWILAPILLIGMLWLIYRQLLQSGDLNTQWVQLKTYFVNSDKAWLIIVILLAPLNWLIESTKWKILVKRIYPISLMHAFASILSGIAFAMITPGKLGEFAGRIMHFPNEHKLKTGIATLVSNAIQALATTFLGYIGLLYFVLKYQLLWSIISLVAITILLVAMFIMLRYSNFFWQKIAKYKWAIKAKELLTALQHVKGATFHIILFPVYNI